MNTGVFDGLVREMGESSSRRNFFRLLGGAAAMGAGLALTAHEDSLAKSHGKHASKSKAHAAGREHGHDAVSAQGRKKTITICYQHQTMTVKKKRFQSVYPGATVGACPPPPPAGCTGTGQGSCATGQTCVNGQCQMASRPGSCTGTGQGSCPTGQTCVNGQCQMDADPEPVVCTYVLSGGPNVTDMIVIDDDGSILNVTTNTFLLIDNDGHATSHSPIFNPGKAGDQLRVRADDWGGSRSFSPLWLHCLETGESTKVFSGDAGNGRTDNPITRDYLDITFPIEL